MRRAVDVSLAAWLVAAALAAALVLGGGCSDDGGPADGSSGRDAVGDASDGGQDGQRDGSARDGADDAGGEADAPRSDARGSDGVPGDGMPYDTGSVPDVKVPLFDVLGPRPDGGLLGCTQRFCFETPPSGVGGLSAIAASGTRLVACGAAGTVIERPLSGATWTQVAAPASADLLAVAVGGGAVAVGGSQSLFVDSGAGGGWSTVALGVGSLAAIEARAGRYRVVGERSGAAMALDVVGSRVTPLALPGAGALHGVVGDSGNSYLVGAGNTVLGYDGTTVSAIAGPRPGTTLFAVALDGASGALVVAGSGGLIATRDVAGGATGWTLLGVPSAQTLRAVIAVGGDILAVGEGGTAVRCYRNGACRNVATFVSGTLGGLTSYSAGSARTAVAVGTTNGGAAVIMQLEL